MQSRFLLGREPIDASGHDALHRFRQIDSCDFARHPRPPVREHDHFGIDERAEKLFQEKRIALRAVENNPSHLLRQMFQLQQLLDERHALLAGERRQLKPATKARESRESSIDDLPRGRFVGAQGAKQK